MNHLHSSRSESESSQYNKSLLNRKELDTDINVNSNLTLTRVCELKELLLDGCEHQRWGVTGERNWASVYVCACASGSVCVCTWGDSLSSFHLRLKIKVNHITGRAKRWTTILCFYFSKHESLNRKELIKELDTDIHVNSNLTLTRVCE